MTNVRPANQEDSKSANRTSNTFLAITWPVPRCDLDMVAQRWELTSCIPQICVFMLLFTSTLLTSFKVSFSPVPLDTGRTDRLHCSRRAPAGFSGREQNQQCSNYSLVSHTGGREITVYTYLQFGCLPLLEAYKACTGCCQPLQELYLDAEVCALPRSCREQYV